MKHRAIILIVMLLTLSPLYGGVSELIDNGDGTGTMTLTFSIYEWMEACNAFEPELKSCADNLDLDNDGVAEQWAVDGGICTQQQADDGVTIGAVVGATTCTGGNITNNRCRNASDPLNDQTGYVIISPSVCIKFLKAQFANRVVQLRNAGYELYEVENVARGTASGGVTD
jgi:hypothetical protein